MVCDRWMPLRTVRSQSLGDQIFEQLSREIILGRLAPGAQLPSERALVTTFGVNRHAVREALKRIEQVGLVRIAQGGGTIVLDFKRSAGLDLMALMAEYASAEADAMSYWLAVHEMRAVLGADAARLCAIRGGGELGPALVALAERMKTARDDQELFELEIDFWERVIDGSGNIAYRLGYNTLLKAVLSPATVEVARTWSVQEVRESGYRVAIARAIAQGDGSRAEAETRESMNRPVRLLERQRQAPDEAKARPPATRRPRAKKRGRRAAPGNPVTK
jgi:GntR family transcriptional regulator, transcriptional repressor for pyruvate dehydrogenase complex